jgi:hypothetical protein
MNTILYGPNTVLNGNADESLNYWDVAGDVSTITGGTFGNNTFKLGLSSSMHQMILPAVAPNSQNVSFRMNYNATQSETSKAFAKLVVTYASGNSDIYIFPLNGGYTLTTGGWINSTPEPWSLLDTNIQIPTSEQLNKFDLTVYTTNALTDNLFVDWIELKVELPIEDYMSSGSITSDLLADGSVTALKISGLSITAAQIADASITSAKIANLAVTTAAIDNASIVTAKIADAAITNAKIDRVSADRLIVTSADIQDATISTAKIADASITTAKIVDASITGAKIVNGSIDTALIADAAIKTTQIADGSITDAKIVTLTANKITAGTINAGEIDVINLHADNITVGKINGQQIDQSTITAENIAPGAIGTEQIALGSVAANKLSLSSHLLY